MTEIIKHSSINITTCINGYVITKTIYDRTMEGRLEEIFTAQHKSEIPIILDKILKEPELTIVEPRKE